MNDERNYQLLDLKGGDDPEAERAARRERARKERAHRNYMRKQRNKIISRLVLIAVVLIAAYLYTFFFRYPRQSIQDTTITRNLAKGPEFLIPIFKEERQLAWDSEIPDFMEKDFKLAKEKGYTIEYSFGPHTIRGFWDEDVPCITIDTPYDMYLSISFYSEKENFSIYYDADNECMVIYAYPHGYSNQFEKLTLYTDPAKWPDEKTLTYDKNLPLDTSTYGSIDSVKYEDYSLVFEEETSTFHFFKDGEIISSRKFHDPVNKLFRYLGYIITDNHLLYKIYAYERDGVPDLKFVYIASDVYLVEDSYGYSCEALSGNGVQLPILKTKTGQFFTVLPEDFDVYKLYGFAPEINPYKPQTNYNISLVNLEDNFVNAEISYDGSWKVHFNYCIGGYIFSFNRNLDGYDRYYSLSEAEKEDLSVTVESLEELWEHIAKIRRAYEPHYSSSFEELFDLKR